MTTSHDPVAKNPCGHDASSEQYQVHAAGEWCQNDQGNDRLKLLTVDRKRGTLRASHDAENRSLISFEKR